MFKDDRMMSMFTFVVIMIALGTAAQRADVIGRLFGDGPIPLKLNSDEIILLANELTGIDVLANDVGLRSVDPERLVVIEQPECGRVFVRDGKAHYLPAARCAGAQTFRYGIAGRDGFFGEVTAVVRLKDPSQSQVTADAQRDIPTPTPGATRPAVTRSAIDPSVLTPQGEAASELAPAAPNVPRPQAGQAAPLGLPLGGAAPSGGPGLVIGSSGQTPSIVVPDQSLGAGPASQPADAPRAPVSEPVAAGPTRDTGGSVDPAATAGSGAAGGPPQQTGSLDLQLQAHSSAPDTPASNATPAPIASAPTAGQPADQPEAALGTLLARESQAGVPQPTIAQPPTLSVPGAAAAPTAGSEQQPMGAVAALAPQTLTAPDPGTAPRDPGATAAPPTHPAEPCTVPPALTIRTLPGANTEVAVDAPCDAGRVARLSYDTLEFSLPLGTDGKGSIIVPGLQRYSTAELRLPSGDGLAFDLPFLDIDRIDRVAMIWDLPVQLDLHAFEFGALPGGDGHVRPDHPRSFEQVRRRGGGYLLTYRPAGGVGQSISVYTYWRHPGGGTGVVKLAVDYTSRSGRAMPGTCGEGPLANPDFRLLYSERGKVAPPGLRRLAPLDCEAIAGTDRLIGDAVDDMIVLQR